MRSCNQGVRCLPHWVEKGQEFPFPERSEFFFLFQRMRQGIREMAELDEVVKKGFTEAGSCWLQGQNLQTKTNFPKFRMSKQGWAYMLVCVCVHACWCECMCSHGDCMHVCEPSCICMYVSMCMHAWVFFVYIFILCYQVLCFFFPRLILPSPMFIE